MKEFIEKLIERLEEQKSDLTTWSEDKAFEIGIETAISIVNQLAEEHEREVDQTDYANIELYAFWKKHQWIPCSERLPCYYDNVLVCTKNGGRTIAHIKHTPIEWVDMYANKIDGVIAWMPLPEPYRTE